jgi:hypothetical protein
MKPGKHLIEADGSHSPNCYPCKLQSVSVAPSAMGTRYPQAARAKIKDPNLEKDREAYKRLRKDGEQPKHVEGSAHFEKHATESFEIEMGVIMDDPADRLQMAGALAGAPAPSSKPIVREDSPVVEERPTGVKRL